MKRILLIIVSLFLSSYLFAQLGSDPCTAGPLGQCTSTPIVLTTADGNSGLPDPTGIGCSGAAANVSLDVWFTTVVDAAGDVSVAATAGTDDPVGTLYTSPTNDCNNLVAVVCDDDGGTGFDVLVSASGLVVGETVWVRISEYNGGSWGPAPYNYEIAATGGTPPANDDCVNAQTLTPNAAPVPGTGYCATIETPTVTDCEAITEGNVWYSFTLPNSGQTTVNITNISCFGSGNGVDVSVFTGGCGAFGTVICQQAISSNSAINFTGSTGITYYVMVDGDNTGGANSLCDFDIDVDIAPVICGTVDFHATTNASPFGATITPFPATMSCTDPWIWLVADDTATAGNYISPSFNFILGPDNDANDNISIFSGGTGALGSGTQIYGPGAIAAGGLTVYGGTLSSGTDYYMELCNTSTITWTVNNGGTGTVFGTGTSNTGNGTCERLGPFNPEGIASFTTNAPAGSIGLIGAGWDMGYTYFDPTVSGPGTFNVTYSWDDEHGCTGSSTKTITVVAPYSFTSLDYAPVCENSGSISPTLVADPGGVYSSATLGGALNTTTGAVNTNTAPTGSHTVTYTLGTAPCSVDGTGTITITALPVGTFSYTGDPYCFDEADPSPTFSGGGVAGTFTSTAGLSITAGTGIVDLSASTPGTYTVTNTIAAAGGCPAVVETASITITALPVGTFSYTGDPYCSDEADPSPTFSGGGVAGTFTSTAGLSITAGTGVVDLSASTPGTYTVTNTIAAAGGCPAVVETTSITIDPLPVGTFSYTGDPYCEDEADPSPTFSGGGVAGTFTSTAGLSITAGTGVVDLSASTPGTYTVTNTIAAAGGCPAVVETASITITALPVGTFSYTGTPYCSDEADPSPTFSGGGVAGSFTSTAGLSIAAGTGVVDLSASTPGTYTVTNTIAAAGGCPAVVETASITITALPVGTFSYTGDPYCEDEADPSPTFNGGGVAGTFTSTAGLSIIAGTGVVDLSASTPGTYTVTNTIAAAGGCPTVVETASITITALQVGTFSYTGDPYCADEADPSPIFSGGGVAGTFTSTAGLSIAAGTGVVDLSASTPGTYTVTNTIAAVGGCPAVVETASITITALPVGTFSYTGDPYCEDEADPSPTFSGGGVAGTFTSTAGLSITAGTGVVDLSASTPGTYTVTNTIVAAGGCPAVVETASITITALQVGTFSYTGDPYCEDEADPSPTFSGGGVAGTFTSTAGLSIAAGTGVVDLSASTPGTYTVTNTIAAVGGCPAVVETASITITALPVGTFSYTGDPYCADEADPSPTFSGGGVAGTFTSTAGLSITAGTGVVDLSASTPGTYTVTNTIAAAGGCPAVIETASITITALPVGTFSYTGTPYCEDEADPSPTFSGGGVAGTFTSTAGLSITAGTGVVDLSASTPGTYTVTNTIAAVGGCPAVVETASITIDPMPTAGITFASECENVTGSGQALNIDVTALGVAIHATGSVVWFTNNTYLVSYTPTSETVDSGEVFYYELTVGACTLQDSIYYNVGGNISLNDPMPEFCEDAPGSGQVTGIDLTTFNNGVFAGATTYTWATGPTGVTINDGDVINIQVTQGTCPTVNIDVNFIVHTLPSVLTDTIELCDDGTGQATFDLTTLNGVVNTGASNTTVTWYTDNTLGVQIITDNAYLSASATVYAQIENDTTNCTDTVPVVLIVNPLPVANQTTLNMCDEGGNQATFDLASLEAAVNTGIGDTVVWYTDAALLTLATPVNGFVTPNTTVYAQVIDTVTGCSDTASIMLVVDPLPTANSTTLNMCDDGAGQADFDLTSADATVNGGNANVVAWFEDSLATISIAAPNAFTTSNDTVYAVVTDASTNCMDTSVVYLVLDPLPTANDLTPQLCEDVFGGGSVAGVDLTLLEGSIDGGAGFSMSWFTDQPLTIPVGTPTNITVNNGDIFYVLVDNGTCIDTAMITYSVTSTITLVNPNDSLCEDVLGGGSVSGVDLTSYNTTIYSGGSAVFAWFDDAALTSPVGTPTGVTVTTTTNDTFYVDVTDGNCNNNIMVTFTVKSQSVGLVDPTICNGDTVIVNGTVYSSSTTLTGTEVFVAANGCDSVVTVNITESPLITGLVDPTICNGDTVIVNGTVYSSSTTLAGTEMFVAANGCDSVVTVNITESPLITGLVNPTICNGDTVIVNGTVYSSSTTLTGTEMFVAANGCDSVVTVNITESPLITGVNNPVICSGDSIIINGTTYNSTNTSGIETFVSANGCDSVVTVNVTVDPLLTISTMADPSICDGDPISLTATGSGAGTVTWYSDVAGNNQIATGSPYSPSISGIGVYTFYVNEVGGACPSNMDSIVVTVGGVVAQFTATPETGEIPLDVDFINTTVGGTSYSWDFGNGLTSTATNPSTTYNDLGTFTVTLVATAGSCSDTYSLTIVTIGKSFIIIPNVFTPNDDGENDVFTVAGDNLTSVTGEIYNRWGDKMYSWNNVKGYWDGRTLSGEEAPDGTYFYVITAVGSDGVEYFEKGGFSLIR